MSNCPNEKYQYGYSKMHHDVLYEFRGRESKGKKIVAILKDAFRDNIDSLEVLDIGCSTGIISHVIAKHVGQITGIDIDSAAVQYAQNNFQSEKCTFEIQDSLNTPYKDCSFDVVVCNHIYEHVPDAVSLFREIKRVLKPRGVCYFSAANRIRLIEPHYRLPFLSLLPKKTANIYIRIFRKKDIYYENLRTLWGLKELVDGFEKIDYTMRIIRNPNRFSADSLVQDSSIKQKLAIMFCKTLYWLCPTYVWLLRKRD